MKIGILTFHYAYNYGSALQAFALKNKLESLGNDVTIINYVYELDRKRYNLFRFNQYKKPYKFLIDIISLKNTFQRKKKYSYFQKEYLGINGEAITNDEDLSRIAEDYDCFICGSDQIWNPECTKKVVPAYFLQFAKNSKSLRISYAPSIAHNEIPNIYINDFKEYLKSLDFISVREKTGKEILKNLTDKPINQVLDPTLLLDINDYTQIESTKVIDDKYILLYTLERNNKIYEYTKELSERKGLKVAYFSRFDLREFPNGYNIFKYGPQEFLSLIHKAEYVITNSFHATIFSILYEKQFLTFTTQKSGSRMKDFLSLLSLEDRIYNTDSNIDNFINYKKVKEKIEIEKEKSLDFLKKVITYKKEL